MTDGGVLICERHRAETRLSCAECRTPICPRCSIKTPVGFKCPDHAVAPGGRRRRGPNRKVVVPVAIVLAVAGALGVRQLSITKPAKFPCPSQSAPDVGIGERGQGAHWKELAESPLCGRVLASSGWTGTELLVWGGQNCAGAECPTDGAPRLADGAAYNPSTNKWRKMARSPLSARDGAATVWTGKELIVWGGAAGDALLADGAAYNPARDSWRMLGPSPLAARTHPAAVWTGQAMLVWGGGETPDGALYDPSADAWRKLPPVALAGRTGATTAWTGKEVLIWSGAASTLTATGQALNDGAAYDPARDAWRPIPAAPIAGRFSEASAWTGQELVVWGGDAGLHAPFSDGAAYNPSTGVWRMLPPAPVVERIGPLAVWSGTEMIVWGGLGEGEPAGLPGGPGASAIVPLGDGVAFNPVTNAWRRLERATLLGRVYPVGAWDGKGVLIWGGIVVVETPASAADGVRYVP